MDVDDAPSQRAHGLQGIVAVHQQAGRIDIDAEPAGVETIQERRDSGGRLKPRLQGQTRPHAIAVPGKVGETPGPMRFVRTSYLPGNFVEAKAVGLTWYELDMKSKVATKKEYYREFTENRIREQLAIEWKRESYYESIVEYVDASQYTVK